MEYFGFSDFGYSKFMMKKSYRLCIKHKRYVLNMYVEND